MTEKELLLVDLCARLPHGTMIRYYNIKEEQYKDVELRGYSYGFFIVDNASLSIEIIKPYLRPLSSMTEDEIRELSLLMMQPDLDGIRDWIKGDDTAFLGLTDMTKILIFLLSHHFDYRTTEDGKTMIEAGLALEAPDGMYNIKD